MEEEIDNETLQAQIDLSLSFAQNLVSSWVKPAKTPSKNSSRALEAELKEIMRRPPRLGVGAPIPEVAISSRETERLKSHLSGKKRARGEDDEAGAKQVSDNEEDSRGASVKKKTRIDPFEGSNKKKKKEAKAPPPRPTPPPPEGKLGVKEKPPIQQTESEEVLQPPEPSSPPLSPSKKKKKHKNKAQPPVDSESVPGPSHASSEHASIKANGAPIPESREASPAPGVIDISLISTAPASPVSPTRRLLNSPLLLKGPILNLDGPPPSDESGGEEEGAPGTPSASPKRKRRKRKKKKSLLGAQHNL